MKDTLTFLRSLKKNNNKEWFDAHRDNYLKVKDEFSSTVEHLIAEIARFEPAIGNLKPKDCIFRINRDIPGWKKITNGSLLSAYPTRQ